MNNKNKDNQGTMSFLIGALLGACDELDEQSKADYIAALERKAEKEKDSIHGYKLKKIISVLKTAE